MKKKYIIVGIIIFALLLILLVSAIWITRTGASQEEDLFKQQEEEQIIVEAEETPILEENTEAHELVDSIGPVESSEIIANTEIVENPEVIENPGFSEKLASAVEDKQEASGLIVEEQINSNNEQQEASMETLGQNTLQSFYYEEISQEVKDRMNGKSYGENCDVPYEELRYVKILYWGFDEQTHNGEMIVNKAIAEDVLEIFKELYEAKYPIEQMMLVDEYDADDNTSMAANNSSAFNYRVIEGTNRISLHSYGMAIDINPLYNPYIHVVDGEIIVTPTNGAQYADRTLDCAYYIDSDDVCYKAFINRGFTWGGEWKNNKDYQHFQKVLPTD